MTHLIVEDQEQPKAYLTRYWFFLCCMAIFITQAAVAGQAVHSFAQQPFTPQFEFYVDKEHSHSIDTIRQLPNSAFQKAPAAGYVGGYSRAVHWLRFTLPASNLAGEKRILRIHPTYTDYITLYQPGLNGSNAFTVQESGELAEDLTTKIDRAFTFELVTHDQPKTLYLRLESTNSSMLVATLYSLADYMEIIQVENLLSGLFIGLLLTLTAINIGYGKWRSDTSFRYYLAFLVASLLAFLSNSGWLTLYLPLSWQSWLIHLQQISTLFYLATLALFYHALFGFDQKKSSASYWLSRGYLLLTGLGFMAFLLGLYVEYMPNFMLITIVYLLGISGIALRRVLLGDREGQLLFIAAILGFSGVLGTALSLHGILSGGIWLMYSYTLGTLGSIVVFQSIMSRRVRQIEQQHVSALLEKEHAEQLAEHERLNKEQKAQFISMLSHELKTPLSVISMGSAQSKLSDKARSHIQQAINDMSRVIDRCAVLEQVDHQVATRQEAVDLAALLNILIQQSQAAERIECLLPQEPLKVQSDSDWLRVILSNLLDNALKYSPPETEVTISVTRKQQTICVDVCNWIADPLPDSEKIFTKYYRAKSAHKQTGSGLGLYIVKRLVDQLGATLHYQSNPSNALAINSLQESLQKNLNQVVMHLCLPEPL